MQGLIQLNAAKTGFVDTLTGAPFVPFGANYYDHETGWAPQIWKLFNEKRVREQFTLMKHYGINTARFFIASTAFMPEKGKVSEEALAKFDAFLAIARDTGIRVIPTGPDHWEGVPDFYKPDMFCGEDALEALDAYWAVMAARYKDDPAIFAWDLRNEPMIGWDSAPMRAGWQRYLKEKYGCQKQLAAAWNHELGEEESLSDGTIAIPEDVVDENNPRLYDYQLYREQIAYDWTRRQVEVIRRAGDRHLVTIGYIQWSFPTYVGNHAPSGYGAFRPSVLSELLDFDCAHFYPMFGNPAEPGCKRANVAYLQDWLRFCDLSRPVVLEEFGWYGGGAINEQQPYRTLEEQLDWDVTLMETTIGLASGWLNWPFADTPSSTDMSKFGGLVTSNLQPKPWGEAFRAYAEKLTPGDTPFSSARVPLQYSEEEFRRLVTGGGDAARYTQLL